MEKREHWGSHLGFILAAAGSAVGLGNIWKFPYITGQNGGGAFVLVYLICILLIGVPVMLAEFIIGRTTQKNPVGAFKALKPKSKWVIGGYLGVLAGFVILSFYAVVGGWTIAYIVKSLTTGFHNITDASIAQHEFDKFTSDPFQSILYLFIFMFINIYIVYHGVKKGIEKWSKILMPTIFIILILLIIKACSMQGAMEGIKFFLTPKISKITGNSVLVALGHALFSLSIGMGAMITYGSYLSKKENLFLSTLNVCIIDTVVALLAGLAIFPAVFAMGFDPGYGAGLVFNILPAIFGKMSFGYLWGFLFFVLLAIAAITSGSSLLEVVTSYFIDELNMPRKLATVIFGTAIFLLGIPSALSFGAWKNLMVGGKTFFNFMDNIGSNYILAIGAFIISIFVGWIWGTKHAVDEIRHGSHNFADVHLISLLAGLKDDPSHNSDIHVLTLASIWGILLRFITPIMITMAFLWKIGAINF